MNTIDRRRKYYLVIDTETANTTIPGERDLCPKNALVYNIGWAIIDKMGRVYKSASIVISEVFFNERQAMRSAYYANKIPLYVNGIRSGEYCVKYFMNARREMLAAMREYNVHEVIAHNARFDYHALNATLRYITASKYRYYFPRDIVWLDSARMARSTICKQKTYVNFVTNHDLLTASGRVPYSAEKLFAYISANPDYVEEHTALADVMIEKEIAARCFRQHKSMNKYLFERG